MYSFALSWQVGRIPDVRQYVLVCTAWHCLVPEWYKAVKGGTRRYQAVPRQYKEVPSCTKTVVSSTDRYIQYILVHTGTYCFVLIFLLNQLMLSWAFAGRRSGFRCGGRGRRLLFMLSFFSGTGAVGAVWQVCCLGLELADQGLGHGTTSNACFHEDARRKRWESHWLLCEKRQGTCIESSSLRINASCWSVREGIKGILSKYVKLLDWTTLKVCLKDEQLLEYIDMKLCDN